MRGVFLIVAISCTFISCNPFEKSDLSKWVQLSNQYFSIQFLVDYDRIYFKNNRTAFGKLPVNYVYWRNSAWITNDLGLKLLEFSYYDIPKSLRRKSVDWILDTCAQHFIRQEYPILLNGRTLENRNIELNEFSGRSIIACEDVGKEDSLVVFQQIFLAHSRIYILRANGYKSVLNRPLINRFLQSFKLTNIESKKPLKKNEIF